MDARHGNREEIPEDEYEDGAERSFEKDTIALEDMPEIVIVTGMSGAGRTEAMHVFEDLGFFCVNNLPASLIGNLLALKGMPGQPDASRRLAVVCDARNRDFFPNLKGEVEKLEREGIDVCVLFLDAADDKLVARYEVLASPSSAVHRRHHHCAGHRARASDALRSARDGASCRRTPPTCSRSSCAKPSARFSPAETSVAAWPLPVYSFGFKHGAPTDADLVMDVRFLPNPYYGSDLRFLTGLDAPVRDFVMYREETVEFVKRWRALLDCVMPGYVAEGKQQLAIAIGCTGGQHRSVAIAESTGDYLKSNGYRVSVAHRDLKLAPRAAQE